MNETIKCLINRRSIRNFKNEQIKKEELDLILEAGQYAPTGRGAQSPIMVVLQNKEDIEKLSKLNAKIMGNENIDPFYGASTIIIVLADKNINTYIEDGSLVMGNLMNAANSLNIGSCWIHRAKEEFQTEEGKQMLKKWGISDNYEGIGHCILGYKEGETPTAKPRKSDYVRFIS